jgi:hypothetical protein
VSVSGKHAAELRQMIQGAGEAPDLLKASWEAFQAAQVAAAAGRTMKWRWSR